MTVHLQMFSQIACIRGGIVTLVTFVRLFSTVYFQMSLQNSKHAKMQSHIGCICLTFIHCAFSNVALNCLAEKRHIRIGCISLTFLHCASSNDVSNFLHRRRHNHICCIYLTFLHCVSSNVFSNNLQSAS